MKIANCQGSRAFVIFTDSADLPWLRCLRSGFRHCYAVLENDRTWFVYNPASHCTGVNVVGKIPIGDLVDALLDDADTVVGCRTIRAPKRMAPIRPFTCVEAVKRVLGIHSSLVHTPWQLFRYLTRP